MKFRPEACLVLFALLCTGCDTKPPLAVVPRVDIPRFMGDWYVIASIPTSIERRAYGALESYRLAPDGRVLTTFTFREGSFDGPAKRYTPVGFVDSASHGAVWGMRFVWPLRADYRVIYINPDYTQTVIGRQARDYAWIMARAPQITAEDYGRLVRFLAGAGYDVTALRRVPQRPAP